MAGVLLAVALTIAVLVGCADGHAHARHTRSLINLAELIKCVTGKHACDYNAYGNWCGIGGSGTPVDEIDGCCQRHDWCYDRLIANSCWPRWTPYNYTCKDTLVNCGNDDGSCQAQMCACDKEVVECFARGTYNPANKKKNLFC
ncbi:basic phospholipase A2 4-like [Lethenteron reissneri]|uniref:basic phospholipase A2 4-like n=1 Tax=Lethenteron reissneri TaxID=7753 RepID=UPI002AB77919|nr:basic phospholipase A2 4-like [Lethenteron reissneri]